MRDSMTNRDAIIGSLIHRGLITLSEASMLLESSKSNIDAYDWFEKKREQLVIMGNIHRYHIVDTTADELNNLLRIREVFDMYEIYPRYQRTSSTLPALGLTGDALKVLGVKRVVQMLGMYWLLRINA